MSPLDRLHRYAYLLGEYLILRLAPKSAPGPLLRLLFRFPCTLYRIGLGRLIGRNVLLLFTLGRRTGKPRVTALGYTYVPAEQTYYVTSGWKGGTDWHANAYAHPGVQIYVEGQHRSAVASAVPIERNAQMLAEYTRMNPFALRLFAEWTGIQVDGSEECFLRLAQHFPALALRTS